MLIEEMLDSIVRTEEEGERLEQEAKAEAKEKVQAAVAEQLEAMREAKEQAKLKRTEKAVLGDAEGKAQAELILEQAKKDGEALKKSVNIQEEAKALAAAFEARYVRR